MKKYVMLIAVMLLSISTARSQYLMVVHTNDGLSTGFNISAIDSISWVEDSIMKLVDLGLSVKWATCNVGASSPEEFGDYFAWGEIVTKSYYDWSTYKYCKGSGQTLTMTKYYTDGKTVLDSEDDAAHVNWGDSWRMPTVKEFEELCNSANCIWAWNTFNGVEGYKIQSRKSGYTDNWIFLPAAGGRWKDGFDHAGSMGSYWSSSVESHDVGDACYLSFSSNHRILETDYRYFGFPVRAVCP